MGGMLGWNPQVPALTVFLKTPFGWRCTNAWNAGDCGLLKWSLAKSPRSAEIYAYFLNHWGKLRFGPPVEAQAPRTLAKPQACAEAGKGAAANQRGGHQGPAGGESQQEAGKQSRLWPAKPGPKRKGNGFLPCATEEKGKTQRAVTPGSPGDGPPKELLLYAADLLWVFAFPKRRQGLCCPSTARGNHCQGKFAARLSSGRGLMLY